MSNKGCKGITYIFIALLLCVAPAVGISQGEAVYLGQHVDIGNVIGWSSEIAWNGGYAPPSAGSRPVVIKLPGSLEGKANYYIDPAVFGKYPGRWYKWDGGSFTSPKENTVVFNVGNLPEEPPMSVVTTQVPQPTVGQVPRVEQQTIQTTKDEFPWGIVVAFAIFGVVVLGFIASQTKPKPRVILDDSSIYDPPPPRVQPEPRPPSPWIPPPSPPPPRRPRPKCEYQGCEETYNLVDHGGKRYCAYHHRLIHKPIRNDEPLKETIKESVRGRARFRCEDCHKKHEGTLNVHHIIPRAKGGTNDMNNLIALCPNCHDKAHKKLREEGKK